MRINDKFVLLGVVKGAIPPIAEMQVMFWISLLKGRVRKPLPPPHYYLLVKETARIKYGVDHSTYMSTLAKDIGASPVRISTIPSTLSFLLKASFRVSCGFCTNMDPTSSCAIASEQLLRPFTVSRVPSNRLSLLISLKLNSGTPFFVAGYWAILPWGLISFS